MDLITGGRPDEPGFDTALSHALLESVAAGRRTATLRLHRPGKVVAFGRQDTASPGYPRAVAAAEAQGFAAVERLAGGRAAVFHPGTIAFSLAVATDDPRDGIENRFRLVADAIADALRTLGADAHVGEVPGEYCPGRFSVNVAGRVKVAGIGQRLVRGAAHVGGVIVVDDPDAIRRVLVPVYEALALPWRPQTVGGLTTYVSATWREVRDAVRNELARRFGLARPASPTAAEIARAETLAGSHLPSSRPLSRRG